MKPPGGGGACGGMNPPGGGGAGGGTNPLTIVLGLYWGGGGGIFLSFSS
jgi:hypothetical protein